MRVDIAKALCEEEAQRVAQECVGAEVEVNLAASMSTRTEWSEVD